MPVTVSTKPLAPDNVYESMLETMIDMPVITRSFFVYEQEDFQRSLQHHKDIVKAITLRQGDLAEQIMSSHLLFSNHRFMSQRLDKLTSD